MSFCPTVNLPCAFNGRERLLRHIPSGYAPQSLEILKQVVTAIGSHWPEKTPERRCSSEDKPSEKTPRYSAFTDKSPRAGVCLKQCGSATSLQPSQSGRNSDANHSDDSKDSKDSKTNSDGDSKTPCSKWGNMPCEHPEILISMSLDTMWNQLFVASVHNALEYLFSIGFRYEEENNSMVFDTNFHLKELEESKNNDLPLPCYLDFNVDMLTKELDDAISWHRRRVACLRKKVANCTTNGAGINVVRSRLTKGEPKMDRIEEDSVAELIDDDLKCAIDVTVQSLLHDRLSIVKDDRNQTDLAYEVNKNKTFIKRVQSYHDRIQNY